MTLNERIVELCKKNKISQSKLERDIGISGGSITKWKYVEPRLSTLEKVADYFGVTVEYVNYSATSYRASCFNHYCLANTKLYC